ncbi:glycosyltransferase involved in cell wall biosynthesis [Murinocardiopsis flavida]|uniref:Glycosyltransferase involved in cell wall biosynthesis n=1 Tax=Murinocardiopsis flavida TaxID=645275 RepID=A0A2P8DMT0_9ACTN|nr:glycosyltransferase [Murinocardiopsis flavida]PSK98509.1 glycosyltransferase involved in cell wall biosynthesis [Murinocardiopsis flavida]
MAVHIPPSRPRTPPHGVRGPAPHPVRRRAGLRVLIGTDTYPPDVNGAAYFTARLARGLSQRGVDVHVLCPSPDGPPQVVRCDGVVEHRLRSMSSLVHESVRLPLPPGVGGHLDRLLSRLRPDVVHVQNHFIAGRMLLRAARSRDVPVLATNHFMPENLFDYLKVPAPLRRGMSAFAWHDFCRVLGAVDHMTTPTRTAARLLLDKGFEQPVEAVSCGIDLGRFRPLGDEARDELRALLGIPDRPTIAFVGRLDAEKHIDDLISALPMVRPDDAQLVIAGVGAQRQRLARLAESEGVAGRVRFLGFVPNDDLPSAYRAADVFAIAGTAELQSIATLEAMASGLPIVAANAMALPHLVQAGHNGYLYPPGDTPALAAHLSRILTAPTARRDRMGRASRTMAAVHDHENSVARFEGIYRELARAHAGR